jgi:geranylgeranyl reductase family protein
MLDVIVVGAGPSGAVLAYLLAKRGLQVLLLEKAALPRYKTCGGGVTWKAMQNLPFDAGEVYEYAANGGILTYKGQELLRTNLGWTVAWTAMRSNFDHFLVNQAVRAGAQLNDGVAVQRVEQDDAVVTVHTGQGNFQSRLLAGGDGVNSIVARSLGLLKGRQTGAGLEAELEVSAQAMQAQGPYATFDFGALPHGYGWIFPKRDHLSVGVYHASANKTPDLRRTLDNFIASQPVLRRAKILHTQGHRIPLGGARHLLHQGRALLVGDAANLADAWIGEGIYYAFLSARLAAETMFAALRDGNADLSEYTRQVNRQIVPLLVQARQFASFVYALPELCSVLLSVSPWMQEVLFSTLRGNRTYEQMSNGLMFGAPRIFLDMVISLFKHGKRSLEG